MKKKSPLIKEIQKGLLAWYDFKPGSKVLYLGEKGDALADYLLLLSGEIYDSEGCEHGNHLQISIAPMEGALDKTFVDSHKEEFDYLVCIASMERKEDLSGVIHTWKKLIKGSGIGLFGFNNRIGIRFFCGDRDLYTERNFDSIEHYRRTYSQKEDSFQGRMYSKPELERILKYEGFTNQRFYSVYSNLLNPSHLFAYGYMPREDVTNRIFPMYHSPETVFLEEESLYPMMMDNDLFHILANAYLVEVSASSDAEMSHMLQVTATMERSPEDAMVTVIYDNGTVEKRAVYPEGMGRFDHMLEYAEDLKAHGIKMVPMDKAKNGLKMPFIDAPSGQLYLRNLLQANKEAFINALDDFHDLILKSSNTIIEDRGDGMGATLEYGYPDMVPLNSFYVDGEFVFFDQEFRKKDYPANVMMMRMISMIYYGNPEFQKIISEKKLYERYNLNDRIDDWRQMEWRFLNSLRNEGELWEYHQINRRKLDIVNSNRQRMNYPEADYERLFVDIFRNADTRKLVLFGSGKFAKKFLELYATDYPPFAIVDNRESSWGTMLEDIEIQPPVFLNGFSGGEFKVIICIKNYVSVMKQLNEMGITEYSVFDPARDYPRKHHPIPLPPKEERKKYHVGYLSGTFDLFHIGHLNLFKRAKEQCDYLMVGVVTDKGTIRHKGVAPFVPFDERIEIVRSCRYVDEAVEIPIDANGPKEAFSMYHFDVFFQGSDHINEPYWIEAKEWLTEHGADMVFFPYTLDTSSTNIKALIEKKLL